MSTESRVRNDIRDILRRAKDLSHLERNIIALYAVASRSDGTVVATATQLAEEMGVTPTAFSRSRKILIEEGWLQFVYSETNVRYYCLSEKATGQTNVRQMFA